MHKAEKKRLEAAGWKTGSAEDFLGLSPQESEYVELKLQLAEGLRARRTRERLTQVALAKLLGTSQSRVAKMEAGDPTVTVDLMLRALLAAGASRDDLARLVASPGKTTRKKKADASLTSTAG